MKIAFFYTMGLYVLGKFLPEITPDTHNLLINLDQVIYVWIMVMIFLPEFVLFFKPSFVRWLKEGIEDHDGELNTQDVKDMLIHYVSLWSLRVFVIFGLRMSFFQTDIDWKFFAIAIFAAFGIEGVNILGKVYGKKNE